MGDQRRTKVLIGVLIAVVLAAAARFTVFSDDNDGGNDATPSSGPELSVSIGATSTTLDPNAIPPSPGDIDIYSGKNPFEPAIIITPSTNPSTSTTSTTVPGGSTTTTVAGATTTSTTTTIPGNNPSPNLFTLLTITRQGNGTYLATVKIGTTTYPDVLEGTNFGPNNTYRFVEGTSDNCGSFQHGDVLFPLCENSSTNK